MPARKASDYMRLVDGKMPKRPQVATPADARPVDQIPSGGNVPPQKVPRAPRHFSKVERGAWRDICKPICDRRLWHDRYALWAESYAVLLARSRQRDEDGQPLKFNQAQLRLFSNDLRQILATVNA